MASPLGRSREVRGRAVGEAERDLSGGQVDLGWLVGLGRHEPMVAGGRGRVNRCRRGHARCEVLALDVVRTLVGSIVNVLAMPLTIALAAWVFGRRSPAHVWGRSRRPRDRRQAMPPRTASGALPADHAAQDSIGRAAAGERANRTSDGPNHAHWVDWHERLRASASVTLGISRRAAWSM